MAALIGMYYTAIATRLSLGLWPTTSGGFIFNSQLRSLLDGRLDIDPGVIGMEGFVRDGLTYTYFGILPALMRLPLLDQLWRDWTTLSCVAASTLASLALLMSLVEVSARSESGRLSRLVMLVFGCTLVLSGPQLELLGKPSVYVEAIAWSYAFACAFLWRAVPLLHGSPLTAARLAQLASLAALALTTRVSTGLALYCAWGFLAVACGVLRPGSLRLSAYAPAAACLASAIIVCGIVNQARWGTPWQFADLSANHYYRTDPARAHRIETLGTFSLERVPHAVGYYFAPSVFFGAHRAGDAWREVQRLFDGPEGPPSSLPMTLPLWWTLALAGAGLLASQRTAVATRPALALAAGLAIAPALMTAYVYLAFRYRAEFAPLVLLLSLVAIGKIPLNRRFVAWSFIVLAATQIASSHFALRAHACSDFGTWRPDSVKGCQWLASADGP